jgi:hypothetical protein
VSRHASNRVRPISFNVVIVERLQRATRMPDVERARDTPYQGCDVGTTIGASGRACRVIGTSIHDLNSPSPAGRLSYCNATIDLLAAEAGH